MGTRSAFVSHEPVNVYRDESDKEHSEYITVKPKLGMGDRNALTDVLAKIGAIRSATEAEVVIAAGAFQMALMERSIVGWRLLDDAGAEIPFDRAMIAQLDPDDELVTRVADEVLMRNPFGKKKPNGTSS